MFGISLLVSVWVANYNVVNIEYNNVETGRYTVVAVERNTLPFKNKHFSYNQIRVHQRTALRSRNYSNI